MLSTESIFNELGLDAITATQLMDWLSLSTADIQDPKRFHELRATADYLKQFPLDTQRFLIQRATNGKMVDKLKQMFEYTQLLKNRDAIKSNLEKIQSEKQALSPWNGEIDPILLASNAHQELALSQHLGSIKEELSIYEK